MLSEIVHEFFNLDKEIKKLEERRQELRQMIIETLKDQIGQTILVKYKTITYKVSLKEVERNIVDLVQLKEKYKSIYDQFLRVNKSFVVRVEIQNVDHDTDWDFAQEGGEEK
ncbi:MAG: hypothetical protein QXQ37_04930 [Nitrososphaerota archaeon]